MIVLLGVCKALRAMHQYKVGRTGKVGKARKIRAQAVRAVREAEQEVAGGRDQNDVEQEPLMDDEVTASQDGVAPGQTRAYAHRDIKPGRRCRAQASRASETKLF